MTHIAFGFSCDVQGCKLFRKPVELSLTLLFYYMYMYNNF